MPRLPTLLATALLVMVLTGCGAGDGGEATLGSRTHTSPIERNRVKIAELKRELRERRRQQGATGSGASRGGLRGSGRLLNGADASSFDRLASTLGGQVGVTVGRIGDPDSDELGPLRTGKAWSTIKLAMAAKVLSDVGGPGGLGPGDGELIRSAITASDNGAAARLFDELKARHGGLAGAAEAVGEPLRQAGDRTTVVSTQGRAGFSPYGQTDWSLREQHRFMARLAGGCVPDAGSARYLVQLMGQVVAGQRWGLGAVGVPALLKGGWGPDPGGGYLVRQMGVLELDAEKHPVVVTVAALPSDGQFASGQLMLARVAEWLVEHVDRANALPVGC